MSRAVGRAVSKISLGGRRSCEDQVVTRREERDNNQGEQFSNIPEECFLNRDKPEEGF